MTDDISDAEIEAVAYAMFADEKKRLQVPISQWEWEQTALTWRNNARAAILASRAALLAEGKKVVGPIPTEAMIQAVARLRSPTCPQIYRAMWDAAP